MSYPETVNLPFNAAAIRDGFIQVRPGEPVPDGPGYWVVLQGNSLVVRNGESGPELPEGDMPDWLSRDLHQVCFGLWQGRPIRALSIGNSLPLPAEFVAEPFNAVTDRLDDRLLTLGGLAGQILQWERSSMFCSRCGGAMEPIAGSWGKRCVACRREHYPHIHPCIIVLVKRGEEFLLIRKAEWPAGRYSLVAGFVDFGESLEECVARETAEEAGVRVQNIHYVGSQNWPFPSQLMAGYIADYAGGDIRPDLTEVEDARWFSPENLPESLPTRRSIARWIIDTYALNPG
jgi:NAD+ diphosphatase